MLNRHTSPRLRKGEFLALTLSCIRLMCMRLNPHNFFCLKWYA
ncbi:hypothetical protein OIU79_013547 [Salix purpurea]|uniref:Uncharacterized protein n=1 Tax=Salix purpurea TaxID=77065 RepID=A0A9Q0PNI3_SALPP|nr:hypothetical protein OIU79_013547 [Salix purpurea]